MRRVYVIWALRLVFSPFMVKIYAAAVFLWEIGSHVYVAKVFSNSPRFFDIGSSAHFFVNAFVGTRFSVQVLVLALLVIGALVIRDISSRIHFGSLAYSGRDMS